MHCAHSCIQNKTSNAGPIEYDVVCVPSECPKDDHVFRARREWRATLAFADYGESVQGYTTQS